MPAPFVVAGGIAAGAWLLDKADKLLNRVGPAVEAISSAVPQLEDEVTVEVIGQPGANKQELYFLALSAANGVVRQFLTLNGLPTAAGLLMIEYDAADHWVRCTIKYRTSIMPTGIGILKKPFGGNFYDSLAVYRGPQCEVVGGNFDFVTDGIPGIPSSSLDKGEAPDLPWAGSVILTSCPDTQEPKPKAIKQKPAPSLPTTPTNPIRSPNPKPTGDNRSRGSIVGQGVESGKCCPKTMELIPLVYAALSDPGSFIDSTFREPQFGPQGS